MNLSRAGGRLALFFVRAYQIFLGPFFGGGCKFEPSCSHYTHEAIERFGARRGTLLGIKRLLRCRPFSPGGYDPVPENWPSKSINDGLRRASATARSLKRESHGVAR
ncbi:MAG: membrane protein insertion efficiency factor YidD [Candidatus Acidiferrales bacterium]